MKTIIANWKMNVGIRESVALARGTLLALRTAPSVKHGFTPELVVCPPFTALVDVHKVIARSHVVMGAQDMCWEETGAFTGEISPRMLVEVGATFVILGHSERRHIFGETDEVVGKKVQSALAHNLVPIVCVGETAEERAAGQTEAVVLRQLTAAFKNVSLRRDKDRVYVAYEPVWAIGSGKPASPSDAVTVHQLIRRFLNEHVTSDQSRAPILYGGSVDGSDAYGFLREPEIDGVLVGGASVKLQEFSQIINAAGEAMEGQAAAGK